jgi:hypothetical protein
MSLMPFLVIGLSWALLGEVVRWYQALGLRGHHRRHPHHAPVSAGEGATLPETQRLATGLATLAALALSPSLMSPFTSSMNCAMSLNWR